MCGPLKCQNCHARRTLRLLALQSTKEFNIIHPFHDHGDCWSIGIAPIHLPCWIVTNRHLQDSRVFFPLRLQTFSFWSWSQPLTGHFTRLFPARDACAYQSTGPSPAPSMLELIPNATITQGTLNRGVCNRKGSNPRFVPHS